jgi:hypothetical protein
MERVQAVVQREWSVCPVLSRVASAAGCIRHALQSLDGAPRDDADSQGQQCRGPVAWRGDRGFVIPVGKAVAQSASLTDLIVWAAIAFVAQGLAYGAAAALVPHLRRAIEKDHVASGILLAALAVAIGMLNAAAMTA